MKPFNELLTEYMQRTGINDSEMARTLGVQRQTIFRWKEGLVGKPRYRDDVLKMATRLRLTDAERDEFLLAAGFAPEAPLPAIVAPPALVNLPETSIAVAPAPPELIIESALTIPATRRALPRPIFIAMALLAIVAAIGAAFVILLPRDDATLPIAAPGETLVIVSAFGGAPTTPALDIRQPQSLNLAERIQSALEREIVAARLEHVRVAVWRDELRDVNAVQAVHKRANARIVIGGAFENGILNATIAFAPAASRADDLALDALVTAPEIVRMKIAIAASEEMQTLTLLAISQAHLARGDFGLARATLHRAPMDADALNFQLGYIYQISKPPDLPQATEFYGKVISATQDIPEAYLNRGVASVRQNKPEWQTDFTRVLVLKPEDVGAHLALCWAYALDKKPDAALPHCDAAVRANPNGRAHEARGIVYAELGKLPDAATDLQIFVDWLAQQPEILRARYGTSRAEWVQMLKAGKNPIDDVVLERLRRE